jgi:hypothetical protein
MRTFLFSSLVALCAGTAQAAETTHYIDIVNTANSSVTSFAIAAAGSGDFRTVALERYGLHGGGDAMTVAVVANGAGAACLHDLRIEFANGRTLIQKNFDVCKYRSYHTGRYLRGQAQTIIAAVP